MKKLTTTLIGMVCCAVLCAQYKKASFFEKTGRTYGLGTQMYALGDGRGSAFGLNLSFGRDQDGKRLFNFWELRYIFPFEFSYETTDLNDAPVTVNGKSKPQLVYAMNYGWYIRRNEAEQVFKPYLTAGFNIVILGGAKNGNFYDVKKVPAESSFSAGIGGGLGGIINLSESFSLKVEGGYTYQYSTSLDAAADDDESEMYHMLSPHPYASLGVRFRITSE